MVEYIDREAVIEACGGLCDCRDDCIAEIKKIPAADVISREEALNFELSIDSDFDEIQGITKGMALYADYLKKLV